MRYGEIRSLEVPTDRTEARWMKAPDEVKFRTINASNVFDSASLIVDGHVMNLMSRESCEDCPVCGATTFLMTFKKGPLAKVVSRV
jgi:hypothetical protein